MTVYDSDTDHKRHYSFLLALSWMTCSGGSQVPCCEDTQAAYRGAHVMRD